MTTAPSGRARRKTEPAPLPAKLLSAQEAADVLGVHYRTVLDFFNDGLLPWIDMGPQGKGRRRMVHPDDLAAFIAARRTS